MAEDMKTQVTIALEDQFTAPLKELLSAVKLMAESVVKLSEQTNTVSAAMNNFQQPLNEVKTDIQAALKPLETMAKDNKELKNTVQATSKQLETGNNTLKHMAAAMEGSCRSADHLEREMTELKSVNQAQARQIHTLQNRLNELAEAHRRAAEEAKKQKEAESTLEKKLESIKDLAQNAGQVMQGVGAAMMAPAVAAGALGFSAVRESMSTNWAETRLGNTFTQSQAANRDANLKDAKKIALDLAMKYPGSTEDVLAAMASMAEMGMEFNSIKAGGANSAVQFASMFNLGFEEAGRAMVQFGNQLGVNVGDKEQGEKMVDELQRLRAVTGADAGSLQETFKYLSPSLAALGQQGIERSKETTTILAMLNKTSMGGSMAGTNYGELLSHTASLETTMGRKNFQKIYGETIARYGIDLHFFDENGKFRGQREMIQELGKLKPLPEQDRLNITKKLFGDTGGRVANILIEQGVKGFDETRKYMDDQLDARTSLANIMDTYKTKFETLQASIASIKVIVGDQILEGLDLKKIITDITDRISGIGKWLQTKEGGKALQEILSPLKKIPEYIELALSKLDIAGQWVKENPQKFAQIGKTVLKIIGVMAPLGGIVATLGTGLVGVSAVLGGLTASVKILGSVFGGIFTLSPQSKTTLTLVRKIFNAKSFSWLTRIKDIVKILSAAPKLMQIVALFRKATIAGMLFAVALKLITNYWENIKAFFEGFAKGFMDKFSDIEAAAERVKIAFEPVLTMIDQALDWLLGKPPKGSEADSLVNGYAMGDTFAKFLELILEIIENVGYLAKAFMDTFADIGRNLAMTWNWITARYYDALTMLQTLGLLQDAYNPDNNFGGDAQGRQYLSPEVIKQQSKAAQWQAHLQREAEQKQAWNDFDKINKSDILERDRLMSDWFAKYMPKEESKSYLQAPKQGTLSQPVSNTVNNTDYSKTSYTFNVTSVNADPQQVARVVQNQLKKAEHEQERKSFVGAKQSFIGAKPAYIGSR